MLHCGLQNMHSSRLWVLASGAEPQRGLRQIPNRGWKAPAMFGAEPRIKWYTQAPAGRVFTQACTFGDGRVAALRGRRADHPTSTFYRWLGVVDRKL